MEIAVLFAEFANRLGSLVAFDRVLTVIVPTIAVAVLIPLLSLVGYVFVKGLSALRATFFTNDQAGITPVMEHANYQLVSERIS